MMHYSKEECRKRGHSPEHEYHSPKKQKPPFEGDFINESTNDVWIIGREGGSKGFLDSYTFLRKGHVKQLSMQTIKDKVLNGDHEFKTRGAILFHPAFNEALLRLLEKVEEVRNDVNNEVRLILAHGVPGIGKSTLAKCLAYVLSLAEEEGEKISVHKLAHTIDEDHSARADKVYKRCDQITGKDTVIFDQVNLNTLCFDAMTNNLAQRFRVNPRAMPLIFFTSGHYYPSEQWLNGLGHGWMDYKIIQMRCDESVVASILEPLKLGPDIDQNKLVQNILELSTVYSHVVKCVTLIHMRRTVLTPMAMREGIFPHADVKFLEKEFLSHIIWIGWQKLILKGLPNESDMTIEECSLEPRIMQYISYWISKQKDVSDTAINCLFNQTDLIGNALYSQNGYKEFDPESCRYIFLNGYSLHNLLSTQVGQYKEFHPKQRLDILLKAYNMMVKEGSKVNSGRGVLLEIVVKSICLAEAERWKYRACGMTVDGEMVKFSAVDDSVEVSTVRELCSLAQTNVRCKNSMAKIFCDLNVQGCVPFHCYDYALIETKSVQGQVAVTQMYLYQVTVNVQSKDEKALLMMSKVLDEVKQELVKLNLVKRDDVDKAIVPYFVQPDGDASQKIALPFRNKRNLLVSVLKLTLPSTEY